MASTDPLTELVLDNKFETVSATYALNYALFGPIKHVEDVKLTPENKVCMSSCTLS